MDNTTIAESTWEDYFNVYNPLGVQVNNPTTRTGSADLPRTGIDLTETDFKNVYDSANIETKRAMIKARNNSDAIKIYNRRAIQADSAIRTQQDGVLTQLGMGILSASASPTTLFPSGAIIKAVNQARKAQSIMSKAALYGKSFGISGSYATAANLLDEAVIGKQGMETNYLGVAGTSMVLGGGLGMFGTWLASPKAERVAANMLKEGDVLSKERAQDDYVLIDRDTETLMIPKMEKNFIDKIPGLGDWLSSPVVKMYQSESPYVRNLASRISTPTVSMKDANGNYIVLGKTGNDVKLETIGLNNSKINVPITEIYSKYKEGVGTGSREDFNKEVYRVYTEEGSRLRNEAIDYAENMIEEDIAKFNTIYKEEAAKLKESGMKKADLKKAIQDLKDSRTESIKIARESHIDKYYADNQPNFKTDNEHIREAANTYSKYFDEMLTRGQKLGVEELVSKKAGRLYVPRNWDFEKIDSLPIDEVKARLREGVLADKRNRYANEAEVQEDVDSLYNILIDKNIEGKFGEGAGYYTKDLPFKKRLSKQKLYVDESKLGDLVHNNFEEVAGMYNYFMSGRFGVQHAFGKGSVDEVADMLQKEAKDRGETISKADIQLVRNVVDDLLGTRRMNQYGNDKAWTFSRNISTYNSARLMGGAGGNQLIEMATIASMNAVKGILFKNVGPAAREVAGLLYKDKGVSSDLGKVLMDSGYLESALHVHRANRIADTDAGFNPGRIERIGNSLSDFQMKFNGQRYFTALAEDLTGGNILQYIKRANPKDEAMFSRWGLTMDDVASLKSVLEQDDKNFLRLMDDKQRDKLQLAITRGVSEWVIQPNSIHLPDWFKAAGPVKKLLFQFMKFPMIAQEVLLRRGLTEDKASMVAGIIGGSIMYTTMKYLREEAAVAMGLKDEIDRKYDIFNNEEDFYRATLESTNYMANLGMFTTLWNYGAAMLGSPELGREWVNRDKLEAIGGPTVGLLKDLMNTAELIVQDGDITSEKQLNNFRTFLPFMAIPGISEGGKYLAEELGD